MQILIAPSFLILDSKTTSMTFYFSAHEAGVKVFDGWLRAFRNDNSPWSVLECILIGKTNARSVIYHQSSISSYPRNSRELYVHWGNIHLIQKVNTPKGNWTATIDNFSFD